MPADLGCDIFQGYLLPVPCPRPAARLYRRSGDAGRGAAGLTGAGLLKAGYVLEYCGHVFCSHRLRKMLAISSCERARSLPVCARRSGRWLQIGRVGNDQFGRIQHPCQPIIAVDGEMQPHLAGVQLRSAAACVFADEQLDEIPQVIVPQCRFRRIRRPIMPCRRSSGWHCPSPSDRIRSAVGTGPEPGVVDVGIPVAERDQVGLALQNRLGGSPRLKARFWRSCCRNTAERMLRATAGDSARQTRRTRPPAAVPAPASRVRAC